MILRAIARNADMRQIGNIFLPGYAFLTISGCNSATIADLGALVFAGGARAGSDGGLWMKSKLVLVVVSLAALTAAGCSSTRLSSLNTSPAPLAAAPSGSVTSTQLPPPATPGTTDPTAFPPAPGAGTDVASLPPTTDQAPANAPDLTAGSVAGVWNATVGGQGCKIATPQTKFGQGYRAGPLRCPAPLDGVKSWNVAGKQLTLYDESGGALARLYSSGGEKFDGQTESGLPISLSR